MKRTLSMVLVLAMLISAMLGVVSFADTEAAGPVLKVSKATVEFGSSVYVYIAVDYSAFGSSEGITLNIKNNKTNNSVNLTPDTSLEALDGCVAFKYDTIGAKHMGDELTIQAMKDGKASGDAKTFSVLEYAIKAEGLGDAKLTALMEAMLAYGSAAQTAYNHKGTYDLAKDYGLVVVKGSNEGKKLAEVGATATFTPNTAKTGANASVYDYSLNKIADAATFTVTAGAKEYLFIGDAQRTIANLDMTQADADTAQTLNNDSTTGAGTTTLKGGLHTTLTSNGVKKTPSGSKGTDYVYWYLVANDAAAGTALIDVVPGANGYVKTALANGKESAAFQMSGSAAFIKNLDEFTMSITIGKEGTTGMIPSSYRIRGSSGSSPNMVSFLSISNSGSKSTLQMNGTTLAVINGEAGVNKFVTLHFVCNKVTNTVTAYVEGNDTPVAVWVRDGSDGNDSLATIIGATGYPIDFTFYKQSGTTLIQKFIFTKGNIFE